MHSSSTSSVSSTSLWLLDIQNVNEYFWLTFFFSIYSVFLHISVDADFPPFSSHIYTNLTQQYKDFNTARRHKVSNKSVKTDRQAGMQIRAYDIWIFFSVQTWAGILFSWQSLSTNRWTRKPNKRPSATVKGRDRKDILDDRYIILLWKY